MDAAAAEPLDPANWRFADGQSHNTECSLREAILNAEGEDPSYTECPDGSGDTTIMLPAGSLTLSPTLGALPAIDSYLSIVGAGDTETIIDCEGSDGQVFRVLGGSGTFTLQGMTIQNGRGGYYSNICGPVTSTPGAARLPELAGHEPRWPEGMPAR